MSQWHSDFNKLSPDLTRKEFLELFLFDGNGFNFEEINKTIDKIKAIEFLLFKFWLKRVSPPPFFFFLNKPNKCMTKSNI